MTGLAYPMWAGLTPGSNEARRVIPRCLFVAARRHHTCLRDASERYRPLGRPARYQAKKTKGLEPHPRAGAVEREGEPEAGNGSLRAGLRLGVRSQAEGVPTE